MVTPKKKSPVKKTAPAKKVVAAKKTVTAAPKKVETKTVKKDSFPTKELTSWLKERTYWDHNDWLSLIDGIRNKYPHLVESDEGRHQIGEFLEANRARS